MKKYEWIGPEGSNKHLGYVTKGLIKELNEEQSKYFLDLGFIKPAKTNKTSNKDIKE